MSGLDVLGWKLTDIWVVWSCAAASHGCRQAALTRKVVDPFAKDWSAGVPVLTVIEV